MRVEQKDYFSFEKWLYWSLLLFFCNTRGSFRSTLVIYQGFLKYWQNLTVEECNAIDLRIQCTVRLRLRKVTLWKLYSPLPFWPSLNYGVCRIHWNGIRLGRCVKWTESNGRADGRIELHSPLGWRCTIYHTKNQKVKSYKTTKTKTFQWQSVSPVLDKPHISMQLFLVL